MLNEFGSLLMKIRTENHESMGGMAEKLGLARMDLTSIEIGRAAVPEGMPEKIAEIYGLDVDRLAELKNAAGFEADERFGDFDNPCTGFGTNKKALVTQHEFADETE